MIIYLALFITVVVCLLALRDWRLGLLGVLFIGLFQDVLRKATPDAPTIYLVWAAAVFIFVSVMATLGRAFPHMRYLTIGDPKVRFAWVLFGAIVILQILNAILRFGSPIIPLFGALFYFGPVIALLIAVGFVNEEKRLRGFLITYLSIYVPACLTVYLSPLFAAQIPLLRDVGTFLGNELIIYDMGTIMASYSGVLRVGEIASWHAATSIFFLSILAIQSPSAMKRIAFGLLIILLLGAIVLTGRRKMIVAVCIFYLVQLGLLAWIRWNIRKVAVLLLSTTLTAFLSIGVFETSSKDSALYLQRGATVFTSIDDRWGTAVMLMKSAFNRSGGLGLGAGAGAQGASYAGVDQSRYVGGSAESGLGKIMVELGVPGFLIILFLLYSLARRFFLNLHSVVRLGDRFIIYQVSFISFLVANLAVFSIATQVFGDLFILIIIGMVSGFTIKIANVAAQTGKS